MSVKSITFVRHGNTDWNNEKRSQGHLNNPLSVYGREQAQLVALRLAEERWDVLFSSDLLRARETAEAISAKTVPINGYDVRLREIDRGKLQGTTEAERIAIWGEGWKELDWGEESAESVRARVLHFIDDMMRLYPGKRILVVSHGFLMGQALKGLLKDESTGDQLGNTSVTTVVCNNGQWEYELYNCQRHLSHDLRGPF
ncbi:histidine phosphatase family protein [Paenibacillus filicis]|uniref:Histidine phosphatase family protein n=1 Tax=Paenibacillus gyeongsangnamensis TaxID=3388067 RepID=A0ABT4QBY7_9BACL|nr:histidine phosphatase family protein [Paenibacillus filicis]MCZ8514395.1 histidine phosphatase family protein [Paenibacillus filicis]